MQLTSPLLPILPHSIWPITPIRLRSRRLNIEIHTTPIIILSAIGITRAPIRRAVVVVTCVCDPDYDVRTAVGAAVVGVSAGCLEEGAGAAGLSGMAGGASVSSWLFGE